MKKILFIIIISCLLFQSCELEEQESLEVLTQNENVSFKEDQVETEPLQFTEPKPLKDISELDQYDAFNKVANQESGRQEWRKTDDGTTFFSREGNTITERDHFFYPQFSFTYQYEDVNFIYVIDTSRNLWLALPIWYPGRTVPAYLSHNGIEWNTWRNFKYFVILNNACDYDKEKPTITPVCITVPDVAQVCIAKQSFTKSFPMTMPDNRDFLESRFNLKDNCDNYLTIRQRPPAGTIIEAPTSRTVYYEVIDNQGNVLELNHVHHFKKINF
ncbi:hypothetical protein ACE939_13605 [Aquimarina sp. W85]|uniref:hypothetical protein n=1 Tax=Aquimarina rhodophyticola TaxID=3342246 RepID=UPI00366D4E5B